MISAHTPLHLFIAQLLLYSGQTWYPFNLHSVTLKLMRKQILLVCQHKHFRDEMKEYRSIIKMFVFTMSLAFSSFPTLLCRQLPGEITFISKLESHPTTQHSLFLSLRLSHGRSLRQFISTVRFGTTVEINLIFSCRVMRLPLLN